MQDKKILSELFEKYKNSDQSLTKDQAVVIEQHIAIQKEIDNILDAISVLDKEIKEREKKIDTLYQQFNFKNGELQGYEIILSKLKGD